MLALHFLQFTDTLRLGFFPPPLISFSLHVMLNTRACYSVPVRGRLMVMPIDFVCMQRTCTHAHTGKALKIPIDPNRVRAIQLVFIVDVMEAFADFVDLFLHL